MRTRLAPGPRPRGPGAGLRGVPLGLRRLHRPPRHARRQPHHLHPALRLPRAAHPRGRAPPRAGLAGDPAAGRGVRRGPGRTRRPVDVQPRLPRHPVLARHRRPDVRRADRAQHLPGRHVRRRPRHPQHRRADRAGRGAHAGRAAASPGSGRSLLRGHDLLYPAASRWCSRTRTTPARPPRPGASWSARRRGRRAGGGGVPRRHPAGADRARRVHLPHSLRSNHVIASIAGPIALVEALAGKRGREPWLGRPMIVVTTLLYLGASALVLADHLANESDHASTGQLVGAGVAAALLIVGALLGGSPDARPSARARPRVRGWSLSGAFVVGLVLAAAASVATGHRRAAAGVRRGGCRDLVAVRSSGVGAGPCRRGRRRRVERVRPR